MRRIRLSADDLARTRIVASYGPYAEALFSLAALADSRGNGVLYSGWRERLRDIPRPWAEPLLRLVGTPPVFDLFTLIGQVVTDEEARTAGPARPRSPGPER